MTATQNEEMTRLSLDGTVIVEPMQHTYCTLSPQEGSVIDSGEMPNVNWLFALTCGIHGEVDEPPVTAMHLMRQEAGT